MVSHSNVKKRPAKELSWPTMIKMGQWPAHGSVYTVLCASETQKLMLILMYGILMNVCRCFNIVPESFKMDCNELDCRCRCRCQKGSASFHYFTVSHSRLPLLKRWTVIIFVFYGNVCVLVSQMVIRLSLGSAWLWIFKWKENCTIIFASYAMYSKLVKKSKDKWILCENVVKFPEIGQRVQTSVAARRIGRIGSVGTAC